ncbi:MAG: hypothetical protein LBF13_04385 [Campylobacteraceae bacterium]|jgi:hypothetical protein|nr:hypothetical protein [Campylobacteraceae bacterium]
MKKLILLSVFFVAFINILNAQSFDLMEQIKQHQTIGEEKTHATEEEHEEEIIYEELQQSLFLSYENVIQRVYLGEIFPVKIKAIITRNDYNKIAIHLVNSEEFRAFDLNSKWEKDQNAEFYTNTFYLQALNASSKLPEFDIELINDGIIIEKATLNGANIEVVQIKGDAKFSHVTARSLAVKSESTSRFDDKSLIVTLEIESTYGNLKEFNIHNGSINEYEESPSLQFLEYTIIVPNYTKNIDFTYFNTVSGNFQLVLVPLNIKSDDLSTHTDLNPKENKFKLYKDILFATLGILGIIIFIFKRYKTALIVSILLFMYLFYTNNPFNKGIVTKESIIRVLPTEKSSIFHVTDGDLKVEVLSHKDGYIKILLPSGRIGWVKEENVVKN